MKIPALNTLPPERRRTLDQARLLRSGLSSMVLFGIALVVAIGILIFIRLVLKEQLTQLTADVQRSEQTIILQQGVLPQDRIKQFNATLSRVGVLQKGQADWAAYFSELEKALPHGITVQQFTLDAKQKQAQLRGIATSRNDLLDMKTALLSSKAFVNPTTPVTNLLDRENIPFSLTLDLQVP